MSSFYQILLAVGAGAAALVAVIKAGPIVLKAMKGFSMWADVQHDVARAITETLPAVAEGHTTVLGETKLLRGETQLLRKELGDHVVLESDAIKLILDSAKETRARVDELESAPVAKAHAREILEAVTEVRDEQLKQNGVPPVSPKQE